MRQIIKTLFRTVTGSTCLFAYLLSTPLAPLSTALLAWIDGEHTVQLVGQEQGARVVLSHDQKVPGQVANHKHCPAAAAMVLFAEPPVPGQSDHVLSFESAGSNAMWERLPTVNAPDVGVALDRSFALASCHSVDAAIRDTVHPAPPPLSTSVVVVRSTVFLI
jgi:hypothetical protein